MTQLTIEPMRETTHTRLMLAGRLQAETAAVLKTSVRKEPVLLWGEKL